MDFLLFRIKRKKENARNINNFIVSFFESVLFEQTYFSMIRLFVFPWIFFIIFFFWISLPPGKFFYLHFPEILTKNLSEDLHRLWKYRTFSNTWKNYSKLNENIPRFIGFLMNETENWCLTYQDMRILICLSPSNSWKTF